MPHRSLPVRFIHTADWQIGKVFRLVDDATAGVLRAARLEAISTLGRLALEQAAPIVLVAGDVYDVASAEDRTLGQPLERMRAFPDVNWHLIPGNHDPHQPGGPWERVLRRGLPDNVEVHLEPVPVALAGGQTQLLPAPLVRRRALADPTLWMDQAPTPAAPPDRPRPRLDQRLRLRPGAPAQRDRPPAGGSGGPGLSGPRRLAWAEADRAALLVFGHARGRRFRRRGRWSALLVEIAAPGALPEVSTAAVGRFEWRQESVQIHGLDDVEVVSARVRAPGTELARRLLDLTLEGTLSLAGRTHLAPALDELRAALCWLRVDDERLYLEPSAEDLEAIAPGGFVRVAARACRPSPTIRASRRGPSPTWALLRLYAETPEAAGL